MPPPLAAGLAAFVVLDGLSRTRCSRLFAPRRFGGGASDISATKKSQIISSYRPASVIRWALPSFAKPPQLSHARSLPPQLPHYSRASPKPPSARRGRTPGARVSPLTAHPTAGDRPRHTPLPPPLPQFARRAPRNRHRRCHSSLVGLEGTVTRPPRPRQAVIAVPPLPDATRPLRPRPRRRLAAGRTEENGLEEVLHLRAHNRQVMEKNVNALGSSGRYLLRKMYVSNKINYRHDFNVRLCHSYLSSSPHPVH
ncbi:serine/arginine repetitive matrix protein 1-like [Sorghum bicolor]|uniref:serine/arginine repetitive matrix protein 1-like n=1 Tax=Sorghum bicolor TaxID=4558 RepID=UPI000B4238B1|nr:serine/arginine repetitive matrix protein 1-like [Sorghum bicolor]|eukprot:XP_021315154.1 serine/arginine repetitive matrix protein 1-like [Sorghum bicolor]